MGTFSLVQQGIDRRPAVAAPAILKTLAAANAFYSYKGPTLSKKAPVLKGVHRKGVHRKSITGRGPLTPPAPGS